MEFEDFDLTALLEEPTKIRSEVATAEVLTDFSGLEFEDVIGDIPLQDDEEEEDNEPHDPEEEAEKLLGLIQSANILLMTPLAMWKAKKKRGGKGVIEKMQIIAAKNFNGQELTAKETHLLNQYNAYLRDKEQLEKAIPYTEDELKLLKQLAIPYCKSSKIKINGGFAFWTAFAGIQAQRVIAIIQA